MNKILSSIAVAFCLPVFAIAANAQTVSVGTSASAVATYGTAIQTGGPYPWSDLGITATADVSAGVLNVITGGSTSFTLDSTVTAGESFVPGTTVLNLGYTPTWSGSFIAPTSANGTLNSSFVYNIGPISGSQTILNVPLSVSSAEAGNLASSLDGTGATVSASQTTGGPGVSEGLTVAAQACFIECATLASASLNFNVGTQIQQTVSATPTVTYGDLVWESSTPTYSASDTIVQIAGTGGNIQTPFLNPQVAVPGLTAGQTFYYNVLPFVQLDMPVSNDAQLGVPASITASYEVFGVGGSQNFPLGNLYTLDTGSESFDFDPEFFGGNFYSVPLVYSGCAPNALACFPSYTVPAGTQVVATPTGGPSDSGPGSCGDIVVGCNFNIPGGPGTATSSYPNLGPLFPGDPSTSEICGPAGTLYAGECINTVTTNTPEPGSFGMLAIGLFALAVVLKRRKFRSQ